MVASMEKLQYPEERNGSARTLTTVSVLETERNPGAWREHEVHQKTHHNMFGTAAGVRFIKFGTQKHQSIGIYDDFGIVETARAELRKSKLCTAPQHWACPALSAISSVCSEHQNPIVLPQCLVKAIHLRSHPVLVLPSPGGQGSSPAPRCMKQWRACKQMQMHVPYRTGSNAN